MSKNFNEKLVGMEKSTRLVFECAICKRIYDKPGMCKQCDSLLKPKGA